MFHGTIKLNPLGVLVICVSIGIFLFYYSGFLKLYDAPAASMSVKTLLIESIIAARRGGAQVKLVHDSNSINAKSKGKTKEGANNPVTDADLKSHYAITKSLHHALGKDSVKIISEEDITDVDLSIEEDSSDLTKYLDEAQKLPDNDMIRLADVAIWIDPLDATQEFTENLLEFVTVMVCVTVKGKPLLGVIHNPFQQNTVWAWVGRGKSSNMVTGGDVANEAPRKTKVIISRSHSGEVTDTVKKAFGAETEVIPAGGAGYKTVQVISGKVDAYVHTTLIKKWDLCAGNALLKAVGGKMTTLTGKELSYEFGSQEAVDEGVLATLHNHEIYLAKF